jgi:uncharacterized protein (TIGR03067 family)
MGTRTLVALAAGLLVAANDPTTKKDLEQIRGTWKIEFAQRAGKRVDLAQERLIPKQFVFADGKVEIKAGDRTMSGTFTLDATQKPKALTLTSDKDKDDRIAAIYLLEGDTLKVYVDEANMQERPKELSSKEGTQQVLAVFKRAKK